jgi:predicted DCC family thiol-disulfide oxidoreductase YuxK
VKPLGYRIYGWVAKYRYRLFGSVPVRPSPSSRSESAPPESR